jgi:hypothetical protein
MLKGRSVSEHINLDFACFTDPDVEFSNNIRAIYSTCWNSALLFDGEKPEADSDFDNRLKSQIINIFNY